MNELEIETRNEKKTNRFIGNCIITINDNAKFNWFLLGVESKGCLIGGYINAFTQFAKITTHHVYYGS